MMELSIATQRREAHLLLDSLPEEKVTVVRNLLQVLVEATPSFLQGLPVEEDELTLGTSAALEGARSSLARGEAVSHDEVLAEFGL